MTLLPRSNFRRARAQALTLATVLLGALAAIATPLAATDASSGHVSIAPQRHGEPTLDTTSAPQTDAAHIPFATEDDAADFAALVAEQTQRARLAPASTAGGNISESTIAADPVLPPANDNFENRTPISGSDVTVTGTTVGATVQVGELFHAGSSGGKSAWWVWTAPTTGTVTVKTTGSNFDTVLAVYTGTSLASLNLVASNDEEPSSGTTSKLTFVATTGTTYHIAVDGGDYYSSIFGDSGNVVLNLVVGSVSSLPANDRLINAPVLSGASLFTTGSNIGATAEAGEPSHVGLGGASVWWEWTAPATGTVTIVTTGSDFDTLLGVYTGTAVSALTPIAGNDQDPFGGSTSRVIFNAVAGTTYRIAVDGYYKASGNILLRIALAAANDRFANRLPLTPGIPGIVSNFGATKETGEPNHVGLPGVQSLWWSWTAPVTGPVAISTAGSTFDTLLAVYTGSSVNALAFVAGNDEDPSGGTSTSRVVFIATAGTVYQIAVDGFFTASGTVRILLSIPPANDLFASRALLTGSSATATAINLNGSKETGEPNHAGLTGSRSLWWTWTAPGTGNVTLTTAGSSFDTTLAVYTGTAVSALTAIASNNNDPSGATTTSRLTFAASAGVTYQIAVDGNAAGSVTLGLNFTVSAPVILLHPFGAAGPIGSTVNLGVSAAGSGLSYAWEQEGNTLAGVGLPATALRAFTSVQPANAGLWRVSVTNTGGTTLSRFAAVGVTTTEKIVGTATEVASNLSHANGNVYDQILLTGALATVTADPGQITRVSFADLSDDLVQIELSGPGTLTIRLDSATGPAAPMLYTQPGVQYMRGNASLVLAGAAENTHLSIFSVGTLTATNASLFKPGLNYDGLAQLSRLSILSPTGRFGSLRLANAAFFDVKGPTGLYAPGVRFAGPVSLNTITAFDAAKPVLVTGAIDSGQITIAGGDMLQPNNAAILVGDAQKIQFAAGVDSHNRPQALQPNRGQFERNGVNVTAQIVAPTP